MATQFTSWANVDPRRLGQFAKPMQQGQSRTSALGGGVSASGWGQPSTSTWQAPVQRAAPQASTYQPPQPSYASSAGGILSQPGTAEQWYQKNAGRFDQPTRIGSYYEGVAGRLTGQRFQPTTTQGAYNQMSTAYGQPGQGQTNAYGTAQRLLSPTQGEGIMQGATQFFSGPNLAHDYANQAAGYFQQPTMSQQFATPAVSQMQGIGAGRQNALATLSGTDFGNIKPQLAAQTYGDQGLAYTGQATQDNQRASGAEAFFRPELAAPSYSEQLYESGNEGLSTFYDRELQKRRESMENQLSAYGLFGSGETVEGLSELEAELGSQQARDMAGLAGQADQAKLGRAGMAGDLASSADQIGLGNIGAMQSAYGLASDEGIAKIQALLAGQGVALDAGQLGLAADASEVDRAMAGASIAQGADASSLARMMGGADVARSGDASRFDQGRGMGELGQAMSTAEYNRLLSSGQLGLDADTEQRARLQDLFRAGYDTDEAGRQGFATELSGITAAGNLAGVADAADYQRLTGGWNAAQDVQNIFQDRERLPLRDALEMGRAQSGVYGDMAGASADEQATMKSNLINLLMTQSGMSYEQAQQEAENWFATAGLGLQGAEAYQNR